MKIIYYGSISTTDCDFPLLREYKSKGVDVVAYFYLANWNKRGSLIDALSIMNSDTILNASEVSAFNLYSSYLDMHNIYVINSFHHKRYHWQSWILWIKVLFHMYRQHADIIHFVWPPAKQEKILYYLPIKKVLTVHDPFPHSSLLTKTNEKNRKRAFSSFNRYVLLNETMRSPFINTYSVNPDIVLQNRLGEYECIKVISNDSIQKEAKTITYFGQIQSHKGIEYLLEAMTLIHDKYPNIRLVVAGKGNFYFDITPYENLDYIEFRNRYIPLPELSAILNESLFVVCPYIDATQSGVVQTAFSANIPLIVTNVGNMPEEVKNGEYGLVVPPKDSVALSEAMEKLLDDPNLLDRFRKNIDEKWRPTMSWEPIAKKYIEMYKELVSE